MTPQTLRDEIVSIAQANDVKVLDLSVGLDLDSSPETPCRAHYWMHGIGNGNAIRVHAETWEELIEEVRNMIVTAKSQKLASRIRKMAFAIMDISDGGAHVTDRDLRLKGFTQAEIDELGDAACVEAARLGAGPFSIVSTQKANVA